MYHGSVRQFIFVRIAMLWIACCVLAAFYFAFGGYLELTVVWGTMALCLSPSVWLYLGLLELRQLCQAQLDQIDTFRQRVHELESNARVHVSAQPSDSIASATLVRSVASPGLSRPQESLVVPIRVEAEPVANPAPLVVGSEAMAKTRAPGDVGRVPNGHGKMSAGNGLTRNPSVESAAASTVAPLREEFAAHVRAGRFAAALKLGDHIAERFPDTRSAHDFLSLRPHLVRRVEEEQLEPLGV